VCDGAGDFDAQQTCDAQEKAKNSGNNGPPEKYGEVPVGIISEFNPDFGEFAGEEDEREEHDSGTNIGPPSKLYRRVFTMRKRNFD
jgi:hypothetical protein